MSSSIPVVSNSFECGGQVAHPRKVESKNFLEKKKKTATVFHVAKQPTLPATPFLERGPSAL